MTGASPGDDIDGGAYAGFRRLPVHGAHARGRIPLCQVSAGLEAQLPPLTRNRAESHGCLEIPRICDYVAESAPPQWICRAVKLLGAQGMAGIYTCCRDPAIRTSVFKFNTTPCRNGDERLTDLPALVVNDYLHCPRSPRTTTCFARDRRERLLEFARSALKSPCAGLMFFASAVQLSRMQA